MEDDIQPEVGIIVNKKIGDKIEKNEPLAKIYANSEEDWEEASQDILDAYKIGEAEIDPPPLIYKTL